MKQQLGERFKAVFSKEADNFYFAPGRINLIGEHTDYNGGHVFPAAITLGTYGVATKRSDKKVRFYSENFPDLGIIESSIEDLSYKTADDWANYPKGMIQYLNDATGGIDTGADILFYGTIPNGAGLSSSASIELLTGVIMEDLFQLDIERLALVKLGQKVENEFIGVNSGIMDQFAIGMGKKDQAMLLDTNTMKFDYVPAKFADDTVVIMNTNKRRELADSKYNERRGECEEALRRLQTVVSIQSLGELDEAQFAKYQSAIGDETLVKRAKHAVTENQRTLLAQAALAKNDLATFGQLLNASHDSLKNDYEVTGLELDTLVAAAQAQPGVKGARMTGAGFGGCGIALVNKESVPAFIENVGKIYQEKIGYPADFYLADIADGAGKL